MVAKPGFFNVDHFKVNLKKKLFIWGYANAKNLRTADVDKFTVMEPIISDHIKQLKTTLTVII
jgi:hypothetical protein